jgi:hypothetical protein
VISPVSIAFCAVASAPGERVGHPAQPCLLTVKPGARSICLQTDRRAQGCKVVRRDAGLREARPKYGRSQPRHDADQPVYYRNLASLELTCVLSDQDGAGWNSQNGAARGTSRIQGWFDMSTFSESYVSRVLFASLATGRGLDLAARRWRWLRSSLCDPYRPELHYMRGPGPKWRERHGRCAKL